MKRVTFATVRKMALALPAVDEGTMYGAPAFFTRGHMFVTRATHQSAERGSLVVRIDFEQRDELLRVEPGTYYLTDHYVGYPCVVVRLSAIHADALSGLLRSAHAFVRRLPPRRRRERERAAPGRRTPAGSRAKRRRT